MNVIGNPLIGPSGQPLPLSLAIEGGGLVFLSGQIALRDGRVVGDTITDQVDVVFNAIEAILAQAGLGLADVARSTIWLTRAEDFAEFNLAYARRFGTWAPARSTVVSNLVVPGALVEIEVTAIRPGQ